jgi:hypothetical protein
VPEILEAKVFELGNPHLWIAEYLDNLGGRVVPAIWLSPARGDHELRALFNCCTNRGYHSGGNGSGSRYIYMQR